MSVKQKTIVLLCFLVFLSPAFSMARAQTIAVFPVDDLSTGINSSNMEVTRYLSGKMEAKGLNVVHEQDIIEYMVSRRIQWLGFLDTEKIMQTKEALGADLVLLGTINRDERSSSHGLILNLVRTRDAKTVWTSSGGLSLRDTQRLLGLNQPSTLGELWPILTNKVLESWPTDIKETLLKP
jgi:hypothetical protein